MSDDAGFEPKWKTEWLPANQFSGLVNNATSPHKLASLGTGVPVIQEVPGGTNPAITGLEMATLTDAVVTLLRVPGDVDVSQPMKFRVCWTSLATDATDTITYRMRYEMIAENGAIITEGSVNDALDTTIAADLNSATAHAVQFSPIGVINAGTLTARDKTGATEFLQIKIDVSVFAVTDFHGANERPHVLGLDWAYVPKRYSGRHFDKRLPDNPWTQV